MKTNRYILLVALALVLCLFNVPAAVSRIMTAGVREGAAPLLSVTSGFFERCREAMRYIVEPRAVLRERQRMEEELARLRREVRRLRDLEHENDELLKHLQLLRESKHELIPCIVLARGDISGWWKTVRINKGEQDGVREDRAVVTASGLLGRVVRVSAGTADVLLLTDPGCRVAGRVAHTDTRGVVRGRKNVVSSDRWVDMVVPPEPLEMTYVERRGTISRGDEIVTSGLGGVFPPRLLIGYVREAAEDPSGLYRVVRVVPAADIRNTRYVFVVK